MEHCIYDWILASLDDWCKWTYVSMDLCLYYVRTYLYLATHRHSYLPHQSSLFRCSSFKCGPMIILPRFPEKHLQTAFVTLTLKMAPISTACQIDLHTGLLCTDVAQIWDLSCRVPSFRVGFVQGTSRHPTEVPIPPKANDEVPPKYSEIPRNLILWVGEGSHTGVRNNAQLTVDLGALSKHFWKSKAI